MHSSSLGSFQLYNEVRTICYNIKADEELFSEDKFGPV